MKFLWGGEGEGRGGGVARSSVAQLGPGPGFWLCLMGPALRSSKDDGRDVYFSHFLLRLAHLPDLCSWGVGLVWK